MAKKKAVRQRRTSARQQDEDVFVHYRKEVRFEHSLLSGRISSTLTSQALLFAGWAILSDRARPSEVLATISVVALIILVFSIFTIFTNCVVIRLWHIKGENVSSSDSYGINRDLPDWLHFFSVEVFSFVLAITFVGFWICFLAFSLGVTGGSWIWWVVGGCVLAASSFVMMTILVAKKWDKIRSF